MIGSGAGRVLLSSSGAMLMCLFLSPKFIEFLRNREFGQTVQEELVQHQGKKGTPTMGGIIIIISFAVPYLCLSTHDWRSMGIFLATIASAAVGFADDYLKVRKRRSLGLRARTKLVGQVLISLGLWWIATHKAGLSGDSVALIPFDVKVDLGPLFPVFIYLVVAGTTNAVNLTDGLDGLAAGCSAIALLAYVGIAFVTPGVLVGYGAHDIELLAGCLCGACIGFLWFNAFPASIFMGDTGSLALGGAIAGLAVMTNTEILLLVIGGIFVIEALSVIIQVFSYRRFRKRVFKIAPLHHHFEMEAWSETKIMLRFWIVAAACGAIGFTLYQISAPRKPDPPTAHAAAVSRLPQPGRSAAATRTR